MMKKQIALVALLFLGMSCFNASAQFKKFNLGKAIQAGKDAAQAISLSDADIAAMSKEYMEWMDKHNPLTKPDSEYGKRLERLTGNFRSDVFECGLSGSVKYGFSHNTIQKDRNQETFDYEISANTNVNLPWDIYLSSDINYSIKSGYGEGFDKNVVLWNAQISKNFLKNKQATLRFKIYDILKQQNNLTRTVTANYTQDSEYNTLNSYFMFHFVYRLNTLGGEQMKGKRAPGGNHGGSRPYGGGRPSSRPMMM